jgi:hypothetical protein
MLPRLALVKPVTEYAIANSSPFILSPEVDQSGIIPVWHDDIRVREGEQ